MQTIVVYALKSDSERSVKWPLQPIAAICFFAGLVELFVAYPVTKLSGANQTVLIIFLVAYPSIIAIWFLYILSTKPHYLYPPSDWSNQQEWLHALSSSPRNEVNILTDFKGREGGEQFQVFGDEIASQYFEESHNNESQIEKAIDHFKQLCSEQPWIYQNHLNLGNT